MPTNKKRSVIKIDKDGRIIKRYDSTSQAAAYNFIGRTAVRNRCMEKIKKQLICGYTFRFADKEEYVHE